MISKKKNKNGMSKIFIDVFDDLDSYNSLKKKVRFFMLFLSQIGMPLLIGILVLVIQLSYESIANQKAFFRVPTVAENFWSLLFGFISFLFKLSKERAKEVNDSIDMLNMFNIINSHKWLFEAHGRLTSNLRHYLSGKIDEASKKGGGIIILQVNDLQYLEWLTECLDNAHLCYEAILTNEYYPKWFFNNEGMNKKDKLLFLSKVNDHPNNRIERIRVMLYPQKILDASFQSRENISPDLLDKWLDDNEVKRFFELHSNVSLYYINLDELQSDSKYVLWHKEIMLAIQKDYALIDKQLVLKRNGKYELSLCFGDTKDFESIFNNTMWERYSDIILSKEEIINKYERIKNLLKG